MITRLWKIVACWLILSASMASGFASDQLVGRKVDWKEFMGRQDMTWEVLPEYWYESAFLGNGELGLMVYREPGSNYLRFETGDSRVHDHRKERGLFGFCRLLTGHFALQPVGQITGGKIRLDLWNAEATFDVETTEGKLHICAFVHADDMVTVVRVETEGKENGFQWKWIPASPQSPRYQFIKETKATWTTLPEYPLNPDPEVSLSTDGGTSVQHLLAGGETAVNWKETRKGNQRTLWYSIAHTYPQETAGNLAREAVDKAVRTGYKDMQKTHRAWWNAFYPASFVSLPDGKMENFYWAQLYKLASATRGDRPLIDCMGPWPSLTPWPNAWWNLNVQLTYWSLNTSNHLDIAASLENALYNHTDNLNSNVPEAYRGNGDVYAIGRASNIDALAEVVGIPGVSKNPEVGNLPWACHNLWLIYRHKMDDELLRQKLFPLLKGAINYYLLFLKEGEDGKLHLPATFSPEYGTAEDCNFDLALLTWGCRTLLDITGRLHITDPLQDTWKRVLADLTPFPQDEHGLMIGKDKPYAFSHRHYSHLLSMYPLYLINVEQPGAKDLIVKSLDYWQSKTGAHQGYSCTGASSISSAIGDGNAALAYLNKLFTKFLTPNTMYRETGPVIETPPSGAQSIHDMLIQSWGDKIRIFPAVPDAWQDVAFDQWRTEGAFLVSAKREKGKTRFAAVKSLAGEPCTVVTDIDRPVFKGNRTFNVTPKGNNTYLIDLKKGEEVLIQSAGEKGRFVIAPLPAARVNCFGKKLVKQ